MAENSKIEWTDHTFNPWVGCTKISAACDNCYAESWAKRSGLVTWNGPPRRTSQSAWRQPHKWNREAERSGVRKRVFCASLADVFDNQAPVEWRHDLWKLIAETPHLDWLLLTKRPQMFTVMLPNPPPTFGSYPAWGAGWRHVSLGVTAENQDEADRRISILLATPAARRFISAEPLLGPLDIRPWLSDDDGCEGCDDGRERARLNWVICGGESGPNARPMHPDWARDVRDQCAAVKVPFFFKQWGGWTPGENVGPSGRFPAMTYFDGEWNKDDGDDWTAEDERGPVMFRVGKRSAGAFLDGREHREMPGLKKVGDEYKCAT